MPSTDELSYIIKGKMKAISYIIYIEINCFESLKKCIY